MVGFPPHSSITALIFSHETPLEALFPSSAPFKVLYSAYALKRCLEYQTQNVQQPPPLSMCLLILDRAQMLRILQSMVFNCSQKLCRPQTSVSALRVLRLTFQLLFICLHVSWIFSKVSLTVIPSPTFTEIGVALEPMSYDGTEALFPEPLTLLDRLQHIMKDCFLIKESSDARTLAATCFVALLKISLHSQTIWINLKGLGGCAESLKQVLLEEPDWRNRRNVAECIRGICAGLQK